MSRVLRNGSSRWRGYARAAASLTLLAWLHEGGGCAQQALTAATAAVEPITGAPPAAAGGASRLLEVVFFDVQQGDATLIRTPGGKAILVDCGVCKMKWGHFDAAADVVIPYLRGQHIRRLDVVIGTHPDYDHIGGLVTLFKNREFEIGRYIDPGKDHPTQFYEELLTLVERRRIPYSNGRTGQRLNLEKGVEMEIMSPPRLFDNTNDCSVVLRVKFGSVAFIIMGDAEKDAEALMKSRYGRGLRSDVIRVGHHGSRSSTGEVFLGYVHPRMAVISCGRQNKFGHPHQETLDRLAAARAKVYRSDEMGTIIMKTDGTHIYVSTKKERGVGGRAKGW